MPTLTHAGRVHELTGDDLIGAHRSCAIVLTDLQAERRHARVFKEDGLWLVEDCGTAIGTFLNGERLVEAQPLVSGAVLRIAGEELTFAVDHPTSRSQAVRAPALPWLELVGRTVGGHQIEAPIGRGSIGMVYRAVQPSLQRAVAFKVFDPALAVGAETRFRTEVAKVGALKHPGLATFHEAGSDSGLLWCSLELVEGETVAALLKRDGVIAPAMALLIAEKVAEAAAAAHAGGVIHGDLRPTTIFIAPDGRVRLTDVGQASIFERAEFDPQGPARLAWYTSPEAFRAGAAAPASDVYSLGCVLWHLLVGRVPFDGPTAGAVAEAHARKPVPALPTSVRLARPQLSQVNDLLQSLMGKTPSWRPQSMTEVVDALRTLRASVEANPVPERTRPGAAVSGAGSGSGARVRSGTRRSGGGGWLVPLIIAVVVLGGVGALVYHLWPQISARHLTPAHETAPAEAAAPTRVAKPVLDLRFDEPADLQAVEILQGQPRLEAGHLTGTPGEPVGLSIPVQATGATWQVTVQMTLAEADGQATVTLQTAAGTQAVIRLEPGKLLGGAAAPDQTIVRLPGPLLLRLRQQGEHLLLMAGQREIARRPALASLAGAQLKVEVGAGLWALDGISVVNVAP